jgi:hypothetical protein
MSMEKNLSVDVERGWADVFVPDAPLRANQIVDIVHTIHNVVTPD